MIDYLYHGQGFAEISRSQERYMVAFQYGSIVFFNFGDAEEEEALSAVRKFCTDEFRETRKDGTNFISRKLCFSYGFPDSDV